jgi:uncharacterized protein YigE (DUF2233 family)
MTGTRINDFLRKLWHSGVFLYASIKYGMKQNRQLIAIITIVFLAAVSVSFSRRQVSTNIISYTVDPEKQHIQLYWKDDSGHILGSIQRLKDYLGSKNRKLVFAMNGGMYKQDYSPLGLFIQNKVIITRMNTADANGNFYLKPNGVFYIKKGNTAGICTTGDFTNGGQVVFATQSGPMLVIDGQVHPAFKKGSSNLNIRNGVGILPGNKLVFAMSTEPVSFFDFADYFKSLGCQNALYLDGFVSRTYLPEKSWVQTDGDFGVIIGVSLPGK